jgi:hypothetical protein
VSNRFPVCPRKQTSAQAHRQRATNLGRRPMAAENKSLARSNKSGTGANATNKRGALPAARAILRAPPIGKTRCGSALPVFTALVMKRHNIEIHASVLREKLRAYVRKARDIVAGKEPLHVHPDPPPEDARDAVVTFQEEPLV